MRLRDFSMGVLALAMSASAIAQKARTDEYPGSRTGEALAAPSAPEAFGVTSPTMLQIPSSAFTARESTTVFLQDGLGYYYATSSPTGTAFWAPVDLPSGVLIDQIGLYYYDNDPANPIAARLQRYSGNTGPGSEVIGSVASAAGSPGYEYSTAAIPNHQVDNNTSGTGGHYMILIDIPVRTNLLRFRGVELRYRRSVSPTPAVATYTDVPIGHPQLRFVEALVASGITAGCGGGNYCPDQPVTRGQMAVFLAVALGMHFPN